MSNWYRTDDLQICRKLDKFTYEFIEFTQAEDDLWISSTGTVDIRKWRDKDGKWTNEAYNYITCYFHNLEDLSDCAGNPENEEQIVAECIFEQTSQFDPDSLEVTQEYAEQYLEDILNGKKEP